ncbi:MAG: hypothetical protein K6A34_02010 [Methanobrevibacter sp.]|nr:hypothetical protein [Methanobrevibacter sp.]
MSNDDFDVDKEIEKISRKTDVNILKTEIAFENRIKQLENDIDNAIKDKEKIFDESKVLTSKHVTNDYSPSSLDRYRKKLEKI